MSTMQIRLQPPHFHPYQHYHSKPHYQTPRGGRDGCGGRNNQNSSGRGRGRFNRCTPQRQSNMFYCWTNSAGGHGSQVCNNYSYYSVN